MKLQTLGLAIDFAYALHMMEEYTCPMIGADRPRAAFRRLLGR